MTEERQSHPVLAITNGRVTTTSRAIAEHFDKQHMHVLRSIREMAAPQDFIESNFGFNEYTDSIGRKLPQYTITRDGFTLLAMGFTGKRAMQWKVRYIEAFNAMESELSGQGAERPTRLETAQTYTHLIDAIKRERNATLRAALYTQLEGICQYIGIDTPPLGVIGHAAPPQPPAVESFWDAFGYLTQQLGLPLDHSGDDECIAVNMPEIIRVASTHGLPLASPSTLRRVLRGSRSPAFIAANQTIRSTIRKKALRCWLFEAHAVADASALHKMPRRMH